MGNAAHAKLHSPESQVGPTVAAVGADAGHGGRHEGLRSTGVGAELACRAHLLAVASTLRQSIAHSCAVPTADWPRCPILAA